MRQPMPMNNHNVVLVLGLSQAKHLQDEAKGVANLVYAGPRLSTNQTDLHTNTSPCLSDIVAYYGKNGLTISGVIVYADIFSLAQFRPIIDMSHVPLLCVVGDTHHGNGPITDLAYWLIQSRISVVALKQTIHHANLFESLGFRVLRLPFYAHDAHFISPTQYFFERTVFIGSTGGLHRHRSSFLDTLTSRGIKIDIRRIPRSKSFAIHNLYGTSFNMPLNNDISYRIWEIMASGSVCLTERFPEEARPHLLAQEDQNVLCYESIDEFLYKLDLISRSKDLRLKIATHAYQTLKKAKDSSTILRLLLNTLSSEEAIDRSTSPHPVDRYKQNIGRVIKYEQSQEKYLRTRLCDI